MELNEFTSSLKHKLQSERLSHFTQKEFEKILESANKKIEFLNKASKWWWYATLTAVTLFVLLIVITLVLYLLYPERLQSLANALPVFGAILLFSSVTVWLYKMKSNLFQIDYQNNLKTAIELSIRRFYRWYWLSIALNTVILLPLYFILIEGIAYKFHSTVQNYWQTILSFLLTGITIVLNHIFYKHTYFLTIDKMKKNMNELNSNN